MCGRYSVKTTPQALEHRLGESLTHASEKPLQPHYNAAPSQELPVVRRGAGQALLLEHFRWGLVPPWAEDPSIGHKMINARSETVFEKPAFRSPVRHQRCLVPANNFFEWKATSSGKQPYRIAPADESLTFMAGIYDSHQASEAGAPLYTFSILTTDANAEVAPLHNRMPVMLPDEVLGLWLHPDAGPEALKPLLRPLPPGSLRLYPVSRAVNSPANDRPELWEPLPEQGGLFA